MKIAVGLFVLFSFLPKCVVAQKAPVQPTNLIVVCVCEDPVGKGYARALRDEIAKSPRYQEITDSKENRKKALLVSIVSLAVDDDSKGSSSETAISVVFLIDGIFIDQLVQTCGSQKTTGCAQDTMNSIDQNVSAIKKAAEQN